MIVHGIRMLEKMGQMEHNEFKNEDNEKMTSDDIVKKYDGKPCMLSPVIPCSLKTCALSKCKRLQQYMSAGKVTTVKPMHDWKGRSLVKVGEKVDMFNAEGKCCSDMGDTGSRAISALDRLSNKGKKSK